MMLSANVNNLNKSNYHLNSRGKRSVYKNIKVRSIIILTYIYQSRKRKEINNLPSRKPSYKCFPSLYWCCPLKKC